MNDFWGTAFTNGAPAWILDQRVATRPKRIVQLVVDTSDSVAAARADTHAFLAALGQQLELHDRCVVWIAGQADVVADMTIQNAGDRSKLARAFDSWPEQRTGSWLAETTERIVAAADGYGGDAEVRLLRILVSDGEFFDAEAVPEGLFHWFPVGRSEHNRLRHRVMPMTLAALPDVLVCPTFDISLTWPSPGASAWALSKEGVIGSPVTAPAAPVDGGFRLVFAGDAEPVLTIARRAGDTATRVPVPAIRPLRGGPYSALRDPRAGHQLDFDPDKLAVLVAIARGGYRSEGHDLICACSQRWYDATARLICPVCQSVLIARGLQPVPQGNYSRVRGVPILAEGGFGKDSPTTQRPSRGKFEVQTDPAGNPLLVVSLLT